MAFVKPWWRHQMETFSALLAICAGDSPVTGEFPAQKPPLMFSLICTWINGWVNKTEADDLRRRCVHYDVTAMSNQNATKRGRGWVGLIHGILLTPKVAKLNSSYTKRYETKLYTRIPDGASVLIWPSVVWQHSGQKNLASHGTT